MSDRVKRQLEVKENICQLVPYSPGKPIEEVKRELGLTDVIKLASNENPLGPSPAAIAAIRHAAAHVQLYPDGSCYELRQAVASHLGVPGDHLIFGNGSDEIIQLIGITFLSEGDELILGDPSFSRYESAAVLNQAKAVKTPLKNWTYDLEAIGEAINEKTRIVFIANPNNPTGTIVTEREVREFLEKIPDRVIVVFDEAYYEYVESADYPDTLRLISEGYNLITLRTFSKAYALAGLRIGYGIARPEIINYLNQPREPFNVNLLAQETALAALTDKEHLRKTLTTNQIGKKRFYEGFEQLGLKYVPTEANFVWVNVERDSKEVFQSLLRRGVITRTGDIFNAPTYLRVTIGTEGENEVFLSALKETLGI